MTELKPCPRCKREAKIINVDDIGYFILCDCGIVLMKGGVAFKNKEILELLWNIRHDRTLDDNGFKTCYFCGKSADVMYDNESEPTDTYCYLLCDCGMEFYNSETSWFDNDEKLKESWNNDE